MEGKKRRNQSSSIDAPLEKGVDLVGRRVRSKSSRSSEHVSRKPNFMAESSSYKESEDDDGESSFKVSMG